MPQPMSSRPVRRLGDFEMIRELGRGGMGVVYEARQVSLNRRVALKVLGAALGITGKAVIRFKREAEAAARLHHTNIVPIYATGEAEGCHYYAMELIEGPSLDQVLARLRSESPGSSSHQMDTTAPMVGGDGSPPREPPAGSAALDALSSTLGRPGSGYFDTVARLMAEVADALDYAHGEGVIHRDIKPSNLLLSPAGRLSLNDFGLARMLEQPGMTVSGEFVGSPMYMSPEQITAGRVTVDHRTDIYSLGATLYEMLTLRPPFAGERRDQVLGQILYKEPRRPRSINKRIPQDLETICLKAIEKDPDRRYRTVGAMAVDLRAYVNRFAISARRVGLAGRAARWVKRHKAIASLLVVALLAAAAAGGFAWHGYQVREELLAEKRVNVLEKGLLAAMSGQFEEAERAIKEAELLGASAGQVNMLRGQVAFNRYEVLDAIAHLEHAVRLLPQSVQAKGMLATAYFFAGQATPYAKVRQELDGMTPASAEDYLSKGYAILFGDAPAAAVAHADEAVRRRDSALTRSIRGHLKAGQAMYEENLSIAESALADLAVARAMLPDSPMVLIHELFAASVAEALAEGPGNAVKREKYSRQAGQAAQKLRNVDTGSATHARLLFYEDSTTPPEQALAELRSAAERFGVPHLVEHYALQLFACSRSGEALEFLDRKGQVESWMEPTRVMILADVPDGLGRAQAALAEEMGNDGQASPMYLPALLLLGDLARAEGLARRAVETPEGVPIYMRGTVVTFAKHMIGQVSEAELLKSVEGSRQRRSLIDYHLGLLRLARGDRAGAKDCFRRVAEAGVFYLRETARSRALLARMEADVRFPRWITR